MAEGVTLRWKAIDEEEEEEEEELQEKTVSTDWYTADEEETEATTETAPFSYAEWEEPEWEEPAFEAKEYKAVSIADILGQAKQYEAITGKPLSTSFIRGVAEPALETGAEEAVSFGELEEERKESERAEAWEEYEFEKESSWKEYSTEKELAWSQYQHEEDVRLEEESLALEEQQLENSEDSWTLVCAVLYRQGHLLENIRKAESLYGRIVDRKAYWGYRLMFDPVVRLMQKSKFVTQLIRPFGVATAYEMASRVDKNVKGNLLGRIILKIGIPICKKYFQCREVGLWRMQIPGKNSQNAVLNQ